MDPISIENESLVLQSLASAAENTLTGFDTTYDILRFRRVCVWKSRTLERSEQVFDGPAKGGGVWRDAVVELRLSLPN